MPKCLVPIILVLVVACGKSEKSSEQESFNRNIVIDHSLSQTFDANIKLLNFDSLQTEKMELAIGIIKLVVATEEFKDRVINHTYAGKKTFVDNNGFTNEEIYQIILNGAEKLRPTRNNTMDAEVQLYYENSNTIGYTYSSSNRIYVNTKYFNSYSAAGVAHNLFHEWLHKLGFYHDVSWSTSRDYSVPYALGYLMGEIGRDFL